MIPCQTPPAAAAAAAAAVAAGSAKISSPSWGSQSTCPQQQLQQRRRCLQQTRRQKRPLLLPQRPRRGLDMWMGALWRLLQLLRVLGSVLQHTSSHMWTRCAANVFDPCGLLACADWECYTWHCCSRLAAAHQLEVCVSLSGCLVCKASLPAIHPLHQCCLLLAVCRICCCGCFLLRFSPNVGAHRR